MSLFDGMACGALAMQVAGAEVDRYVAYEVDKYCIETSTHNFPQIEHRGDVFDADFTEFQGFDWLIGGSPCTYWSIAQKNNRETTASGMGWELFQQYVRALNEAKPKYFIYENNKSMAKAIKESISKAFGFEPILINSALVSAQNRQRYYWVGIRQSDGTYKKAEIEQPVDRGIVLRDILETGEDLTSKEKAYVLTASYGGAVPCNTIERNQRSMVAEPVCVAQRGRNPENPKSRVAGLPTVQMFEVKTTGKTNCLTTVQKDNLVAEPIRIGDIGSNSQAHRVYSCDGKSVCINAGGGGQGSKTGLYATPIDMSEEMTPYIEKKMDLIVDKYGYLPERFNPYNASEILDKAPTQTANCGGKGTSTTVLSVEPINITENGKSQTIKAQYDRTSIPNICCYTSTYGATGVAIPTDEPVSEQFVGIGKDRNAMKRVYEVKNGFITIKGKQYPIKLADGYYIIRKLTVRECMRLQTVPEWYEFPVSNSQAYKMLGNGWTVDVIKHLIEGVLLNEIQSNC